MTLDPKDRRIQMAFAIAEAIHRYTLKRPMEIEHILEALAFTGGHSITQKAAKRFATEKALRDQFIAALDRGIAEGNRSQETQLFLPSDTGIKF